MVIFHSYVSLPEGMPRGSHVSSVVRLAGSESNSLWALARLRQHLEVLSVPTRSCDAAVSHVSIFDDVWAYYIILYIITSLIKKATWA